MKTLKPSACLASLALAVVALTSTAEETAVVKDGHVNVRGQPSLAGEVITQLQKGETVVVLDQVKVAKPKTNEPPVWARIQMPPKTPVWVFAPYVDATNKTVKVTRLNLRAGPGENFSVVGRLSKGATVSEIRRVEQWMEIETPADAYGFVAANLLTKAGAEPAPVLAKHPQPSPAPPAGSGTTEPGKSLSEPVPIQPEQPKEAAVPSAPPVPVPSVQTQALAAAESPRITSPEPSRLDTPAAQPPSVPEPVKGAAQSPAASAPVILPAPPAPGAGLASAETLVTRVVRREGLVRSTASIQAPTYYELLSPENHKTINYLHVDKLGLDLKDYRGRRVVVTGQEMLDQRWPKTPVIEVDKLELIP